MYSGRYRLHDWVDRMIEALWRNRDQLDQDEDITTYLPTEVCRKASVATLNTLNTIQEGLSHCRSFKQFEQMIMFNLCGEFIAFVPQQPRRRECEATEGRPDIPG